MTVSLNKKAVTYTAIIAIAMMASFVLVKFVDNTELWKCLNAVWILVICLAVISDVVSLNASRFTKSVIFAGLIVRIAVVVLALTDFCGAANFLYSNDPGGFRWNAYNYYSGDFSFYYTNYPYVINAIFHLFGPYMVMPHSINVLLWYLGFRLVIYDYASAYDLHGTNKQLLTMFYWLMPMQVIWTSALYRESLISFSILCSILFVTKWKENHRFIYIVMAVLFLVPSMLMHMGNSSAVAAIFLTYILWDKRNENWDIISWKIVLIVFVLFFFNPIYETIVALLPPSFLPSTLSFESIAREDSNVVLGRADYITGHTVASNPKEFMVYSLYRMLYFWASPTPRFWSSLSDIIGFLVDSVPWILFLAYYIKRMRKCKTTVGWIGVFLFFAFTFVYGWGTSNAGTAIRHRGEMIAPLTFLFMYMIQNENSGNTNVVEE